MVIDPHAILMASLGGLLIGLASVALLLFNGRIAGISGIAAGLVKPLNRAEVSWRASFISGMLAGGVLLLLLYPSAFPATASTSLPLTLVAGVLVGFGTQLGSGCTSGHGVCGISRMSARSIIATLTFMSSGALTVLAMKLA